MKNKFISLLLCLCIVGSPLQGFAGYGVVTNETISHFAESEQNQGEENDTEEDLTIGDDILAWEQDATPNFSENVSKLEETLQTEHAAIVGETTYTTLKEAIAATENDTIYLLKDVTEDLTIDKDIIIDGGDSKKQITGHVTMKNGKLTNVTLTNDQNKKVLTIGNDVVHTKIIVDKCNIIVPIYSSLILLNTASGNMANITIQNSNIINNAHNEYPTQWSYGFYIMENQDPKGSFNFLNNNMKGGFKSLLGRAHGNITIKNNVFETTFLECVGISMPSTPNLMPNVVISYNTFINVPYNLFSYSGYHNSNEGTVDINNNSFKFNDPRFIGYIQLAHSRTNPETFHTIVGKTLDLSNNSIVYDNNIPVDTAIQIYGNVTMPNNVIFKQSLNNGSNSYVNIIQKNISDKRHGVAFDDITLAQAITNVTNTEIKTIEILNGHGDYKNENISIPEGITFASLPTPTLNIPQDKVFLGWSDGTSLYSKVDPAFEEDTTLKPIWNTMVADEPVIDGDREVQELGSEIIVALPENATTAAKTLAEKLAQRLEIESSGLAQAALDNSDSIVDGENKVFLDVKITDVSLNLNGIFEKIIYQVKPYLMNLETGKSEIISELTGDSNNTNPIDFILPIGATTYKYVKVVHKDDNGTVKDEFILPIEYFSGGTCAHIEVSLTSFSSLEITLTSAYTISSTSGEGGNINPEGKITIEKEASQVFEIKPNSGYSIKDVIIDGVSKGNITNYTFDNVNKDHSIYATFTPNNVIPSEPANNDYNYYTITATVGIGGSITPNKNISVREGKSASFDIIPNKGYQIADVKINGVSIGSIAKYTFTNVRSNQTIEADFKFVDTIISPVTPPVNIKFDDVKETNWFYDVVKNAVEKGYFAGTSATTFSPNAITTRGMIATVLHRIAGSPNVSSANTHWYGAGQAWAMEMGISDGTNMTGNITREQLATILYRYAQIMKYDTTNTTNLDSFTDSNYISDFASEAMKWAVACKLIGGKSATTLDPRSGATRAEVAAILGRFDSNIQSSCH